MVALIMIAYFVGAILAYFWWAHESKKQKDANMITEEMAEQVAVSGMFFSMFWFIFVLVLLIGEIIEWIKKK